MTTHQIALAAHSGTAVMGGWDERVPMASDGGNVRVMPFDDVCEEQGIRPDVVKIDVFGAEGDVLRGMKKALRNGVSHLFCELHQCYELRLSRESFGSSPLLGQRYADNC